VKTSSNKTRRAKTSPKKETWLKELRGPVLKAISRSFRKWDKAVGLPPKCYDEPWAVRIGELIEGSICKVFNIKSDPDCDAMTLGILAAQGANCAETNLCLQLKGKKLKPRTARGMRNLISLASPIQEALGRVSRRIMRVMDRQPWETRIAFHNGYARGLGKKMFQGPNPVFFENTTTRLYVMLLFLAPCMHQVRSVNHLHGLLFPHLRAIVGEDPKRLEKVCERIGLRFRKRSPDNLALPVAVTDTGA
jgi:hypothetical protein